MTLPALMLAVFLCAGLIYSVQGALILDQAAADACKELAENSYLLQQAWGLGVNTFVSDTQIRGLLEKVASTDAAKNISGYVLASSCLHKYLKSHPEVEACIEWKWARLPGKAGDEGGAEGDGNGAEGDGWVGLAIDVAGWAVSAALDQDGGTASGASQGSGTLQAAEAAQSKGEPLWKNFSSDEDDVVLILTFTPAKLNRIASLLPDSWQITVVKRQRAWLTGQNLQPGRGLEQAAGKKGQGPLVYITRWGVKYHMDGCRYLRKSQIPAYLDQLSVTYGACMICKPPPRE